jgi:hypothetical protein
MLLQTSVMVGARPEILTRTDDLIEMLALVAIGLLAVAAAIVVHAAFQPL